MQWAVIQLINCAVGSYTIDQLALGQLYSGSVIQLISYSVVRYSVDQLCSGTVIQ